MKIKTGTLYHIKDEFFDIVNDEMLMSNHEFGSKRPTYFIIKDKGILWFIPLSSRVEKYKKIINDKIKKYGSCKTILIRKIANKPHAILLQNAFPTLKKYIDHIHMINGKPLRISTDLKEEILTNFKFLLMLKEKGKNLFFPNIDKIKKLMLEELKEPIY